METMTNSGSTTSTSKQDAQSFVERNSLCLNDIWRLARQKWEAAGRPPGDSGRFWLEAEQELVQTESEPDAIPSGGSGMRLAPTIG